MISFCGCGPIILLYKQSWDIKITDVFFYDSVFWLCYSPLKLYLFKSYLMTFFGRLPSDLTKRNQGAYQLWLCSYVWLNLFRSERNHAWLFFSIFYSYFTTLLSSYLYSNWLLFSSIFLFLLFVLHILPKLSFLYRPHKDRHICQKYL